MVGLIAAAFVAQADNLSRALGMPDWPRVTLPYPVAGIGLEGLRRVARDAAPKIVERLEAAQA